MDWKIRITEKISAEEDFSIVATLNVLLCLEEGM